MQLQPTSGSYFGASAAARLHLISPPRGLDAGPLAGIPGWRGRAASRSGAGWRAAAAGASGALHAAAGGTVSLRSLPSPLAFPSPGVCV